MKYIGINTETNEEQNFETYSLYEVIDEDGYVYNLLPKSEYDNISDPDFFANEIWELEDEEGDRFVALYNC